MKLLFYIFMLGFIIFLNIGLFIPSFLAVNEEEIGRNMNRLKKYKWFQEVLGDKEYKQLIIHDKEVRRVIGKFNDKKFFQNRYRRKLQNILQRKLNNNFA